MSEYRWYVKKAWIGVMRRIRDERGLFKEDKLLGVIRRSGTVRAVGHFCHITVSIGGWKYIASGAEDRIFPFHSIKLEGDAPAPKLELEYVGWSKDGCIPVFRTDRGELVELVKAGKEEANVAAVPRNNWPKGYKKGTGAWQEIRPGVFQQPSTP